MVLEVFNKFKKYEMGVTEISKYTGLNKSTVHRFLLHLKSLGYVQFNKTTKKYFPGHKILELSGFLLQRLDIINLAKSEMEVLMQETQKTTHLVQLNGLKAIYISKVENPKSIVRYSYIGKNTDLYCTAVGKVLLAYLEEKELNEILSKLEPLMKKYTENTVVSLLELRKILFQVKKNGYAIDNEELEMGLKCIAAPIRNYKGNVIAAVSISGYAEDIKDNKEKFLVQKVINAANNISKKLGF